MIDMKSTISTLSPSEILWKIISISGIILSSSLTSALFSSLTGKSPSNKGDELSKSYWKIYDIVICLDFAISIDPWTWATLSPSVAVWLVVSLNEEG